jgi:hypothetical protein
MSAAAWNRTNLQEVASIQTRERTMKDTTAGGMRIVGTVIAIAVVIAIAIMVFLSGGTKEAGDSHLRTPETNTQR